MASLPKISLVVPSIRPDSFARFADEWNRVGLFEKVNLILVEDNPKKTIKLDKVLENGKNRSAVHVCWEDIDQHGWSQIIPRRSDTVRSFGYWLAWKGGCDYLMTLDDDCYPEPGYEDLVDGHLRMMDRTRWFYTLNNVRPRGTPYKNLGRRPVMVNHGLWTNVLDYDAPQQLVDPVPETFSHDNRIVPHGAYFSFCGMNAMWRREAIPLSYHLLMGQRVGDEDYGGCPPQCGDFDVQSALVKLPFDRFGDIWSGIIMKRVADHLGWAVSSGTPYIHHDRASDPFKNLVKEAPGIAENETFWERIDRVDLTGQNTAPQAYRAIADVMRGWGGEYGDYWEDLGAAMTEWIELFKEP